MVDAPQTHYLNADFDLGLRPRSRRLERPALARQVRELSAQALLGALPGDAALIRANVPEEFLDHLAGCGLSVPRVLLHPRLDPRSRFRPFGWSAEAIELNRQHRRPVGHPPLEVVERVNSRSFARALEADLTGEDPPGAVVERRAELEAFLSRASPGGEWIVKAEHGNSGLANRRLRSSHLSTADRRFVDGLLAEDDRLVVEPWRPRQRDWCAVFRVPFDPAALRVHETVYTRDGALIGALFEPGGPIETPWANELAVMAEHVASRLDDEGYFGPVCVDAFGWCDGDRTRLRSLVDLNCRLSMSDGAHRMWLGLGTERALYYRFFKRRKLALPTELGPAVAALGERRYDHARRGGVFFASPFRFDTGDASRPAARLAVVFVGEDRSEIFAFERWFRARFES